MLKLLPRIILALFFWGVLLFVAIIGIPYPDTLTAASPTQLLFFLIPLFLSLTFTINIAIRFLIISTIISTGITLALILKALHALNLGSLILIILALYLFISYILKDKSKSKSTSDSKTYITGLLKNQTKSKLSPLNKLKRIHE